MDINDSSITTKSLTETDYNKINLFTKISAFKCAYNDLLSSWEKFGHHVGEKDYPFDKSFDELEIEKWLDSFKGQLNIS